MRRLLAPMVRSRPEIILLGLFVVVLVGIRLAYGGSFTPDKLTAKVPLIAVVVLALVGTVPRLGAMASKDTRRAAFRDAWSMFKDWFPFILCVLIYENLHDTVKLVHPETLDGVLARMDEALFGVQPTIWLQRITNPWLTDYMTFAYGSYFFTPTILAALLYYNGRKRLFRDFLLAVVAGLSAGYLGYVIVPAIGPRHFLRWVYDAPQHLSGILLYHKTAAIFDDLQAVNRDCFPSLHTAISTITLVFAWRSRRAFPKAGLVFWVYLPLTVSLWFSTVYLRYHWVVDVIAGWALATLVVILVPVLNQWWDERRAAAGLPPLGQDHAP